MSYESNRFIRERIMNPSLHRAGCAPSQLNRISARRPNARAALRSVRAVGLSAAATLALAHAATAQDRILWSFRTADSTPIQFLARAADGTIYTADADFTYALSPRGALLWITPAASGDDHGARPIEIGADGTIYTGVGIDTFAEPSKLVIALAPDGSVKWEFDAPTNNDLAVGPSIGPDGNIYAVQEGAAFGGGGLGPAPAIRPSSSAESSPTPPSPSPTPRCTSGSSFSPVAASRTP
jgi:hypothetical protein